MIKEETYRKNLKIIDKELEDGSITKARRMIREEIYLSELENKNLKEM